MKCEICGKEIKESKYSNTILCSDECFFERYWLDRVEMKDTDHQVVANGIMYQIGDENSNSEFRGFDGNKFKITFNDGKTVYSSNLWYNGPIPEKFRSQLQDNATIEGVDE